MLHGTNIDQDLKSSREAKYRKSQEEAKLWLFECLKITPSQQAEYSQAKQDLLQILQDGRLLCALGNMLNLPASPTRKVKNSRMPFVQMENIMFFLQLCEMVGVPADETFQTVDLYERKDAYQVIVTLMAFSRRANEYCSDIPVLGPKVVKIKPSVPVKPLGHRMS